MRSRTIVVALLVGLAAAAGAQSQASTSRIVIAASSSSGTYSKLLGELVSACSSVLPLDISENTSVQGGAPGNLDALVNKEVDAAFMHSDVFLLRKTSDPELAKLGTLVSLWPEQVHVLALATSRTGKHGMSFGKQQFTSTADLRGYSVGGAGGGFITATVFDGTGKAGFSDIVKYPTGDALIAALDNGQIAAAFFVGSAPLPNLKALKNPTNYKLLTVDQGTVGHLGKYYRPASLSYGAMGEGVQTVAPIATIITRRYSTPGKIATQAAFRACLARVLPDLKEGTGTSRAWNEVEENDHGVLENYIELPASAAVQAGKRKP